MVVIARGEGSKEYAITYVLLDQLGLTEVWRSHELSSSYLGSLNYPCHEKLMSNARGEQ